MLLGKKLQKGDTIGLIAPSGAVRNEGAIERAIEETKRMGYRVKVGESCGKVYGYLSGTDEVRARDINTMFADDEVDAIICVRGGYGATRLLDLLDYDVIRANPKIFVGYSDITALHAAMYDRCALVTFHAPMAVSDWSNGPLDEASHTSMLRALATSEPMGDLVNTPDYPARRTVNPGRCEATLVGGNLSLITALLGTPYQLDVKDKILFIEEIGERTYCVDRMLTQLRLSGAFEQCAGVVFGDFKDCPIEYPAFGLSLEAVIRDIVAPCGKPVFTGMQIGHCTPKLSLPHGVRCRMDADSCTLTVLEAAVRD